jgi:hypothetical protein
MLSGGKRENTSARSARPPLSFVVAILDIPRFAINDIRNLISTELTDHLAAEDRYRRLAYPSAGVLHLGEVTRRIVAVGN